MRLCVYVKRTRENEREEDKWKKKLHTKNSKISASQKIQKKREQSTPRKEGPETSRRRRSISLSPHFPERARVLNYKHTHTKSASENVAAFCETTGVFQVQIRRSRVQKMRGELCHVQRREEEKNVEQQQQQRQ